MRILIVSSYFPPHVGGVEVVAEQQARVLAAAGHDVVVATSQLDRAESATEQRDGYRIRRLPVTNVVERRLGIPYPVALPGHRRMMRALVGWAQAVHVHDVLYQPPQIAAALASAAGRPLYATQHVGPVNHPHPLVRAVEWTVGRFAGRRVWARARRIVSYNPMVDAHLSANGVPARRIVRSSIGVDTGRYAPGPVDRDAVLSSFGLPTGLPLVLFVGRLVDKKGYRHMLRATGPGHHVVLVGPGRPAEPLPEGVTFVGPQPREHLIELYRAASVFALPSHGEVFPIAAQEAMACGLPVVLTDSPGYDAYGVDRTLIRLVEPEPAAIREAIGDILGDDGLGRDMGWYSRRLAETHFDAADGRSVTLRLYDDALPETQGALWT
jgi:glycosyltransferase involved in cell wall biosynthesis